jgi:VanZ family protein
VSVRRRTAWWIATLWMVALAWGSTAPGVGVPSGPDLLLHAAAYLGLAWVFRHALAERETPRHRLLAGALAWGFGFLMEGLQMTLVYRSAEARDLVANALGAGLGLALPRLGGPGGR